MNSFKELESYLHMQIPLSKFMGVEVIECSSLVCILKAPFKNNQNHKCTIFGGSLGALSTLACWSYLFWNVQTDLKTVEIVICESQLFFKKPVQDNFKAVAFAPKKEKWELFLRALNKKGKARIQLEAFIGNDKSPSVTFSGTFAALKTQ